MHDDDVRVLLFDHPHRIERGARFSRNREAVLFQEEPHEGPLKRASVSDYDTKRSGLGDLDSSELIHHLYTASLFAIHLSELSSPSGDATSAVAVTKRLEAYRSTGGRRPRSRVTTSPRAGGTRRIESPDLEEISCMSARPSRDADGPIVRIDFVRADTGGVSGSLPFPWIPGRSSSAWQSNRLVSGRSGVQIPSPAPSADRTDRERSRRGPLLESAPCSAKSSSAPQAPRLRSTRAAGCTARPRCSVSSAS